MPKSSQKSVSRVAAMIMCLRLTRRRLGDYPWGPSSGGSSGELEASGAPSGNLAPNGGSRSAREDGKRPRPRGQVHLDRTMRKWA